MPQADAENKKRDAHAAPLAFGGMIAPRESPAGARIRRVSACFVAGAPGPGTLVWLGPILSGISGADLPLFQPAGRYVHEKVCALWLTLCPQDRMAERKRR